METNSLPEVIGSNLRTLCAYFGLQQAQVADYLGLLPEAVEPFFDGRSKPNVTQLQALSDLFWVPLDALLRPEAHLRSTFPAVKSTEMAEVQTHTLHHLSSFYRVVQNYGRMERLLAKP